MTEIPLTLVMEYTRGYDDSDAWGHVSSWAFAVCDVLTDVGADIPAEWEFRQAPGGSDSNDEQYLEISTALHDGAVTVEGVSAFGQWLMDCREQLVNEGRDY